MLKECGVDPAKPDYSFDAYVKDTGYIDPYERINASSEERTPESSAPESPLTAQGAVGIFAVLLCWIMTTLLCAAVVAKKLRKPKDW